MTRCHFGMFSFILLYVNSPEEKKKSCRNYLLIGYYAFCLNAFINSYRDINSVDELFGKVLAS